MLAVVIGALGTAGEGVVPLGAQTGGIVGVGSLGGGGLAALNNLTVDRGGRVAAVGTVWVSPFSVVVVVVVVSPFTVELTVEVLELL